MKAEIKEYKCIYCGSENTTRHEEKDTFVYGASGNLQIEVTADVIVSGCIDCGQQWTDGDQEQIRSDAACAALYKRIAELEQELADASKGNPEIFSAGMKAGMERAAEIVDHSTNCMLAAQAIRAEIKE